jgi:hypothetical protein
MQSYFVAKKKKTGWGSAEPLNSVSVQDNAERGRAKLAKVGLADAFAVVVAPENGLQIDYDFPALPDGFRCALNLLRQRIGASDMPLYETTKSRSGNIHVHIPLPEPMPIVERIAWQAVFGSDQLREGISLINVYRGAANPVLLFERK